MASVAFRELTEEDLRGKDATALKRLKQEQLELRDQAQALIGRIDVNIAAIERAIDQKAAERR